MQRYDWTVKIRKNLILLKVGGLWPKGNETYKRNLYSIYAFAVMTFFMSSHNLGLSINMFMLIDDLEAATAILFVLLTQLVASVKAYYVIQNMDILKQLTATLNSDVFQPKHEYQKKLIEPHLNMWSTFFWAYWGNGLCTLTLWATFPIFDKTYKEFRLPILVWYPHDYKKPQVFEITYGYQIMCCIYICIVNLGVDTLIGALNMFIAAQCELLCDNLRNITIPDSDSSRVNVEWMECITHHKEILKFADNLQRFYNGLVLFQFFASAISIGVTMFQLTVVIRFSSEFYSLLFYQFCLLTEIFVFCWFGNEVEVKSSNIPYAAFQSNWTHASLAAKKEILFFILRCQTPIRMSALNVFYLSLDTFTRILRTAWSYFALLNQVNSQ